MTKQTKISKPARRRWTLKAKTVQCVCQMCGTEFQARTGSMYCSNACKQAAWRARHSQGLAL